ncbi:hypothetical protein ACFVR6_09285 [Microbacterium sp. NPDC058021]|uniref:hypothetical protein n=1 Tax=Microbacterium sp. NPDC058021 TaxID=3346306 RepID=UPI0036DA5A80
MRASEGGANRGAAIVIVATGIAGVAGYGIQAVAGFGLDAAQYAGFSVFWAALFLIVGAVGGVQQEIARAVQVSADADRGGARTLLRFAALAAVVVAALVLASSPLWARLVFPTDTAAVVALLCVGGAASVCVAVAVGTLYGAHAWRWVGAAIIVDPVLRLMLVSAALAARRPDLIEVAIVAPILLTLVLVAIFMLRMIRRGVVVDVPMPRLIANAGRTLAAAAATAVMISAFPLFIGAFARDTPPDEVGALLFNLTVTRAPLVIPALALQSLLIVRLRHLSVGLGRRLAALLGAVFAVTAAFSVVAGVWIAPLIGAWLGEDYAIGGVTLAALVASAGLTAALCITGAAVVARGGHTAFVVGWIVAAACSILLLAVPGDLDQRVVLALTLGPVGGLAIHIGALIRRESARGRPA